MSQNLTNLSAKKGLDENLFDKLQHASQDKNSSPEDSLTAIAGEYNIGSSQLLGATSFYDLLRKENNNKKVFICNGTACMLAGKQSEVKSKLSEHFKEEEIGELCCLGRCHENAAFQLENRNYSGESIHDITAILDKNENGWSIDRYHVGSYCHPSLLMPSVADINFEYQHYRDLLKNDSEDILRDIYESGLRGRGGAGYPLALKLEACKEARGAQKYIVCNADEGDPGSYSDRYLLEYHPHSVLLGMLISGHICGADHGILYIRAEYPESIKSIEKAIKEYHEAYGDPEFSFKIIKGAGSYVCGEETALLSSIEGQRPEVRIRPPFPTTSGLYGKPTLVSNVETLACLPFILDQGSKAFKSIGTQHSTGSKLICLDSFFNRPGVYEVPFGISLSKIIYEIGMGFTQPVKALHIGGPLGGIVPSNKWEELTLDFESFAQHGFSLGHASFISIPESYSMIKYMEHLFQFTAHESCGKCFPCRLGSQRGMELLQKAQVKDLLIENELFNDLLETMEIGSLCGLGSGLPLPVRNILKYFSSELQPFFNRPINIQ